MPRQTALIVQVPEAEPAVREVRLQHDSSAASGVPAHITILYPFVNAEDVDEDALADLFSRFRAFDFALDRVERFEEGIVWLHPEPSFPFVDLTAAVAQRWPDHPPYEGMFDEAIPHLTVSETPIDFRPELPIAARAQAVTLIERDESSARWAPRRTFPLGA
ncbi:MAG: 2'-5' RNA ligase family protein [Gaiellaceae bacterium]